MGPQGRWAALARPRKTPQGGVGGAPKAQGSPCACQRSSDRRARSHSALMPGPPPAKGHASASHRRSSARAWPCSYWALEKMIWLNEPRPADGHREGAAGQGAAPTGSSGRPPRPRPLHQGEPPLESQGQHSRSQAGLHSWQCEHISHPGAQEGQGLRLVPTQASAQSPPETPLKVPHSPEKWGEACPQHGGAPNAFQQVMLHRIQPPSPTSLA